MDEWINRGRKSIKRSSNSEQLPHVGYGINGWASFYFPVDNPPKIVSLDPCTFVELTNG